MPYNPTQSILQGFTSAYLQSQQINYQIERDRRRDEYYDSIIALREKEFTFRRDKPIPEDEFSPGEIKTIIGMTQGEGAVDIEKIKSVFGRTQIQKEQLEQMFGTEEPSEETFPFMAALKKGMKGAMEADPIVSLYRGAKKLFGRKKEIKPFERTPPAKYPDAVWSDEYNLWTVRRDGKLKGIAE